MLVLTFVLSIASVNLLHIIGREQASADKKIRNAAVSCAVGACILTSSPTLCNAAASAPANQNSVLGSKEFIWNMGNGEVRLTDSLTFLNWSLRQPRLLGSGGGGAVFAYSKHNIHGDNSGVLGGSSDVAVKVSWLRSSKSVETECSILQELSSNKVEGVVRCLGSARYPSDTRRAMIVMEPVVEDPLTSISDLDSDEKQIHSVKSIMRTLVQVLASNVVTADVQPLISKQTGDVTFIDMTEAHILKNPFSFLDLASISSFCAEMVSLIPEGFYDVASRALTDELQRSNILSEEILDILHQEEEFLSQNNSE